MLIQQLNGGNMTYHHALIFYRTITQVHVGCGQEVGVVDLPVIRERSTGYPYFPGSGIRGSVREEFENPAEEALVAERRTQSLQLFGPEDMTNLPANQNPYAGCLAVHDARVLLFPVRSDKAVFLWVTCPMVLNRFLRDITAFQLPFTPGVTGFESPGEKAFVGPDTYGTTEDDVLHLEEFRFVPQQNAETLRTNLSTLISNVGTAMGIDNLATQTVLLHDKAFYHFVNYATVITQHNRLTSAKT
ncbi:MAG: type III-B CRISPR module RAMP protein Cmr4, partial [Methanobacteriota archaeon]